MSSQLWFPLAFRRSATLPQILKSAADRRTSPSEILQVLRQLRGLRLSPRQQQLPIFRALHLTMDAVHRPQLPVGAPEPASAALGSPADLPGAGERLHLLWLYPALVRCVTLEDGGVRSVLQETLVAVGETLGLQ